MKISTFASITTIVAGMLLYMGFRYIDEIGFICLPAGFVTIVHAIKFQIAEVLEDTFEEVN